jgi:glycosyltransferase involved in cell wall biosynthesis
MSEPPTGSSEPTGVVRIIARTNVGGPSLQVTALMRHLETTRFQQTLLRGVCEEGETDYLDLRASDVPSTIVPGLGRSVKLLGDVQAFWYLVRQLRRLKPTIVHTHTAKAGALGRCAAVLARTPIRVHTFHGHVLHGYFGAMATRVVTLIERLLARTTTYVVAVGEQTLQDLIDARIADPRRSSTIAPGVERGPVIEAAEARARLGLPEDGLVATFVGRLTDIKRPERFIEIARELQTTHPTAIFAVVGDGSLRPGLEADAPTNVRFLGWQSDIPVVMQAADLLVLTSDNEGMPVALIEAAMHGIPAVATDAGTTNRVVLDGESGLIVPVGDQPALNAAVDRLLGDADLRRSFGAKAAAHAATTFSERRLVDDYAALYSRLLAERSSR